MRNFPSPASTLATFRRKALLAASVAAAVAMLIAPARADIIKDTSIKQLATGFGDVPRLISVQTGSPGTENGCDSNMGGVLAQNVCSGVAATSGALGYFVPNSN